MSTLEFSQLLGNYGEFVGAIGIVITLIYLAVQIRQTLESTRAATLSAFMQSYSHATVAAGQSIEHARILRVGHATPDELDEDEATVWNFLISPFMIHWETLFRVTRSGAVDAYIWKSIRLDIVLFQNSRCGTVPVI